MDKLDKLLEGDFVFKGAKISLNNALNHFEAGEILAGKEKFGLATSHIILAGEECAKSMILMVKYNKPRWNSSDVPDVIKQTLEKYDYQKVFSRHKPKQDLASFFSFMAHFIVETYPIPISVIDDIMFEERELTKEEINEIEQIRDKRISMIKKWRQKGELPDLGLKEISNWWRKANSSKNNGFYVGIENEKWKKPQDFTKEDYDKAYNYVSGIIAFMDRSIELQKEYNSIIANYE